MSLPSGLMDCLTHVVVHRHSSRSPFSIILITFQVFSWNSQALSILEWKFNVGLYPVLQVTDINYWQSNSCLNAKRKIDNKKEIMPHTFSEGFGCILLALIVKELSTQSRFQHWEIDERSLPYLPSLFFGLFPSSLLSACLLSFVVYAFIKCSFDYFLKTGKKKYTST